MKKSKKFIASVMASALALCSVPAVGASAAPPPSTEPRIYIELTEDDKGIRADIIMENVPEFRTSTIALDLGKSWECVEIDENSMYDFGDAQLVNVKSYSENGVNQYHVKDTQENYIILSVGYNLSKEDYDQNGIIESIYIKKTELYNTDDSAINLQHDGLIMDMSIRKADGTNIFESVYSGSPRMLEADEFMYGDVTGDGYISGSDATWALSAVKQHGGRIKVTDLYNNYKYGIKDMKAAYAADVNKDGYIDETDANIILYTYTELLSNKSFDEIDGIVGDIDVYEVY